MKKRQFISAIITAIIGIAGTITMSVLYANLNKNYDASVSMGVAIMKSFYNAKDAMACELRVLAKKEDFARCESFVDQAIEDYRIMNETFRDDISKYR